MPSQILDALNWRYAVKKFDPDKRIPQQMLDELLEVLRLTPSSYGLQPWKFVVVETPALREKLKAAAWNQSQITDASHLVVLCRRTDVNDAFVASYIASTATVRAVDTDSLTGLKDMITGFIKNLPTDALEHWTAKQTYIALGMLLESCALLKIDACPFEGFSKEQFDDILDLPNQQLASVVVCAIGYRSADDHYASQAKSRFPREEVIKKV